jgi:hypothetical protein
MKLSTALIAGMLLTAAVPASAQSLGELAKREAERRKAVPPAAKTYTNGDLKAVPPPTGTPGKAAEDTTKPGETKPGEKPGETKTGEPQKVDSTKPPEPAKDEAYWRARVAAARESVRSNEVFAEALQSRINALTAEFTGKDDPFQRAKVADDRQKALAELQRVKTEVDNSKKLIAEIEDEARRAGVPAGWIR